MFGDFYIINPYISAYIQSVNPPLPKILRLISVGAVSSDLSIYSVSVDNYY